VLFDGHAGHEPALVHAQTFTTWLDSTRGKLFGDEIVIVKQAIRRSFYLVNDELRRSVKDGMAAVIVGRNGSRLVVAHISDSLALIVTINTWEWFTRSHRPTDRSEYLRMRRQRKTVTADWRVNGNRSESRSLGDFRCCDGMFDEPEVLVKPLPHDAVSIILDRDGLGDYMDVGSVCTAAPGLHFRQRKSRLNLGNRRGCTSRGEAAVVIKE
jgi:serine/threonine protein phosphatase PrpC